MNNLPPVNRDATDDVERDASGREVTGEQDATGERGADDAAIDGEGGAWRLPRHAHIVVYDQRERELLTIYDCGAAQKPPSAQLLGNLVRVKADCERRPARTGYTVSLREPAVLYEQSEDHYVVEPA